MADELEQLRAVARAAGAWAMARDAYHAHLSPAADAPHEPWTKAFADELHRLSVALTGREAELVRAVARLAEAGPGLFDPNS